MITELQILEEHGHGVEQAALEMRSAMHRFPALYDQYVNSFNRHGAGTILYTPEAGVTARYLTLELDNDDLADQGMQELIGTLHENLPDANYIPVVYLYKCGHVAGYILTAAYGPEAIEAQVVDQVFGLIKVTTRFVGQASSATEPWDIDL